MAVQEFGIPSGFEADLESISGHTEIKRTETEDRKVILYFDEVGAFYKCKAVSKHSIFTSTTGWLIKKHNQIINLLKTYLTHEISR